MRPGTVRARISIALGLLVLVCGAAFCLLLHKAGCVGDLKIGRGDVLLALVLEDWSMVPFGLTVPLSVGAVLIHPRCPNVVAAICLIVWPLLWWLGSEVETAAVINCLKAQ